MAAPARLHGHEGVPRPDDWWLAWHLDPWVVVPLLLFAASYAAGIQALWGRAGTGRGVSRLEVAAFWGGMLLLAIALISPLHALGSALFSAHMLQHVVLMVVAALLLVLGRPLVVLLWSVPRPLRQRLGRWLARPGARRLERTLTVPLVAWAIHAGILWVWHVPALYEATLWSDAVHALQHASFLGGALLFWWAAVEFGRTRRTGYGTGVIYVFTTAIHSSALGALLTFSLVLWYPVYGGRTAAWGLTPLEDQQLGGLVMWVPGGIAYLIAALLLLAAWLHRSDRAGRRAAVGGGGASAGQEAGMTAPERGGER